MMTGANHMKNSVLQKSSARALIHLFRAALLEGKIFVNPLLELPSSWLHDDGKRRALAFILTSLLMAESYGKPQSKSAIRPKLHPPRGSGGAGVAYSPDVGGNVRKIIDFFFSHARGPIDFGSNNLQRILFGVQAGPEHLRAILLESMIYIRQNWQRVPDASSKEENFAIIKIARLCGFFRGAGFEEFIFALQQNNSASDPIDLSMFI